MKKILLASLLSALTLSTANAAAPAAPAYNPAGNGFYIVGQIGGGVFRIAVDETAKLYKDGKEIKDGVLYLPSGGAQLNWGVSKRFSNDMTVGFEAAFLSPGARLGYMIGDTHHISVGVHYGLMSRLVLGSILEKTKEKISFSGMSFTGASISYEHFTASKNFFRVQLRADYYGIEGTIKSRAAEYDRYGFSPEYESSSFFPKIDGKATVWDICMYVGFGSQW